MSTTTRPFLEYSIVRLRIAKTSDQGKSVEPGRTGTIVHVHPVPDTEEPAYIVEFLGPHSDLVEAGHGELILVSQGPDAPPSGLSKVIFAGACISAFLSLVSIAFCIDLLSYSGNGWAALGTMLFLVPILGILPLLLLVIPSAIRVSRSRRKLDVISLVMSAATVLVTVIEVVVLASADLHGC